MSVKVMTAVFDRYPNGGSEMVLALALADHAHDDGTRIYPGIKYLAEKTRQTERNVQKLLRKMQESGWLVAVGFANGGRSMHTEYRISLDWIKGENFSSFKKGEPEGQNGELQGQKGELEGIKRVNAGSPANNHHRTINNHQGNSACATFPPAFRHVLTMAGDQARKESSEVFHDDVMSYLQSQGWVVEKEFSVESRGDGRTGRIDLLVTSPVVIGIELDRCTAREKSIVKLRSIDGYRVVMLRDVSAPEAREPIDGIDCVLGFSPEPAQKPQIAGVVCAALKAIGIPDVAPSNALLVSLIDGGVPIETFVATARECAAKGKFSFRYVLKAVEGQEREARDVARVLETQKLTQSDEPVETYAQRAARQRMEEISPMAARKAPGQQSAFERAQAFMNGADVIDVTPTVKQIGG